jgi:succinate dehydrogenase/fumarate reductase flavoprotein subunit
VRDEALEVVREQVQPYDKNYLRHGDRLRPALAELDLVWSALRSRVSARPAEAARTRQAAAMVAHARWMYSSALARTESRGMARREEFPALDPAQHHRLTAGGLDQVWVRPESAARQAVAS